MRRPTEGTNLWVELLPYFEQDNLHDNWDYDDNRNNVAGGTNAEAGPGHRASLSALHDPLTEPVPESSRIVRSRLGLLRAESYRRQRRQAVD